MHEEEQPRHFVIIDDEEDIPSIKLNDKEPEQLEVIDHMNYADITHSAEKSPANINYTEIATPSKKMKKVQYIISKKKTSNIK